MKLQYVLGVALDLKTGFTVGLTKKRGPSFLLNKVTFPGGKMEAGEPPETAMSREMEEECGIHVPASDWLVYSVEEYDGYTLTKLVAPSTKVLCARTKEDEPVWHLSIESHLRFARNQPAQYAPDFIKTLEDALAAQANHRPLALAA